MKKTVLLALLTVTFAVSGCGSQGKESSIKKAAETAETVKAAEAPATAEMAESTPAAETTDAAGTAAGSSVKTAAASRKAITGTAGTASGTEDAAKAASGDETGTAAADDSAAAEDSSADAVSAEDAGSGMEPEDLLGTWYRIDGEIDGDLEDTAAHGRYSTLKVYRKESTEKGGAVYYADYYDDDRYDATEQYEEVPLTVEDGPVCQGLDSTWYFASDTIHTQIIEMKMDVVLQAGFIDSDTIEVVLDSSSPDGGDGYDSVYGGTFVRSVPDCYGLIPDDLVGDWEHAYTEKADGSREKKDGTLLSVSYVGEHMSVRQYESADDFDSGNAASEWAAYDDPVYRPAEDMETTEYNSYWNMRFDGPDYAFNENYFTLIDKDTLLWVTRCYEGKNCTGKYQAIRTVYTRR